MTLRDSSPSAEDSDWPIADYRLASVATEPATIYLDDAHQPTYTTAKLTFEGKSLGEDSCWLSIEDSFEWVKADGDRIRVDPRNRPDKVTALASELPQVVRRVCIERTASGSASLVIEFEGGASLVAEGPSDEAWELRGPGERSWP